MGSVTGFKKIKRKTEDYHNIKNRLNNYEEITISHHNKKHISTQGARCMDCGVPFCQADHGCPINNLIPEFNDLVYKNRWFDAYKRLIKTNNFPEFTGRVCPAPCEHSCVLSKISPAVTIKNIEQAIIDEAFNNNFVKVRLVAKRNNKTVAVVGSGPAGLACADELNQMGYMVTVFERDDRAGGLLMYGIPNMKLDKKIVTRRIELLTKEGIKFVTNTNIGEDITLHELQSKFDAVLLATGATEPRNLLINGRDANGVYFAMEYLKSTTQYLLDHKNLNIDAKNKNVIVIGGGDTGTDCIATATRQGAKSVVNFELMAKPPNNRTQNEPWPLWPNIYRVDYGHAEAQFKYGEDPRKYQIMTKEFVTKDNKLVGIKTVNTKFNNNKFIEIPHTTKIWQAELILLSMGFISPEHIDERLILDGKNNYKANYGEFKTNLSNVFTAGDCRRGQSLVVWAIHEGREAALTINSFLNA